MYQRKTTDEFTIQGNYGQGWEDVTAEDNRREARERLKEYRENEPQYPHRLITRRVKVAIIRVHPTASCDTCAYTKCEYKSDPNDVVKNWCKAYSIK